MVVPGTSWFIWGSSVRGATDKWRCRCAEATRAAIFCVVRVPTGVRSARPQAASDNTRQASSARAIMRPVPAPAVRNENGTAHRDWLRAALPSAQSLQALVQVFLAKGRLVLDVLARKGKVQIEVALLGSRKVRIEGRHRLRQPRRQQLESLAGSRLDQRATTQQVQASLRLVRRALRAQFAGIAPGCHPGRAHASADSSTSAPARSGAIPRAPVAPAPAPSGRSSGYANISASAVEAAFFSQLAWSTSRSRQRCGGVHRPSLRAWQPAAVRVGRDQPSIRRRRVRAQRRGRSIAAARAAVL